MAIKFLSFFTSDYGLLMNVYFIAGFGVTAAVTFAVLRHLRFGYLAAAVAGFLYTFLPFHFYHEQSHLFRSSYFYAPLACLVLLWSMSWRERFLLDPDPSAQTNWRVGLLWNLRSNLRRQRVLAMVGSCVLLAGTETMTTSFTLTLLAITGLIGAIRRREPAQLLVSGALALVLAGTFLALLYPTFNFVNTYGTNERAARRKVVEQEVYGLKISAMVLPSVDHQNDVLRELGKDGRKGTRLVSEGGQALTMLGVVGFVAALYRLVTRGWDARAGPNRRRLRPVRPGRSARRRCPADPGRHPRGHRVRSGPAEALPASQVRVWNRMVLIIAFFSSSSRPAFERLGRWISGRITWPQPLLVGLALLVAAFGIWDGGRPARRDYPAMAADFGSDLEFVARIEQRVPDGTNVFQLPVTPFPESPPPGDMLDYDHLRPFLQSDGSTNWSYGSVKGRRNGDWQWRHVRDRLGPIKALPPLLGMGFEGLWVDTFGYADAAAELRDQLAFVLRVKPMVSGNGRHLYYDLRPYKERLGRPETELRELARRELKVEPPEPGG
ncbi:MAG: hypothetical protein WKF43_04505 [Acidimicrobiales bacterium]